MRTSNILTTAVDARVSAVVLDAPVGSASGRWN
jgi:hypothetical protein